MILVGLELFNPSNIDFNWNMFDLGVVGVGILDFGFATVWRRSSVGGVATLFRMVRLLRILRIFRIVKFLKQLYLLAFGFVLYICAIVLVRTVGRPPDGDPFEDFLHVKFDS